MSASDAAQSGEDGEAGSVDFCRDLVVLERGHEARWMSAERAARSVPVV